MRVYVLALEPMMHTLRSPRTLAHFAWSVLAYNLLVIAWGAFVRASGSGAGCGKHWPLCNGEVVPQPKSVATVIEATHRLTSGVAVVAVLVLMVWTLRAVPRGHRARSASIAATVFIFGEALIGAGLVLFELVAHDASMKRGLSMILHLGNTFLLLGALTVTAWTLTVESGPAKRDVTLSGGAVRLLVWLALTGILFLGSSGAIAALGDTLFPAASLKEGMAQDLSPLAHVFLRLRVLHPVIALATGILVFVTASGVRMLRPTRRVRTFSKLVTVVFMTQFVVGLANLSLLAPVPMQIIHLLLADATWIALVLMAWETLYAESAPVESAAPSAVSAAPAAEPPAITAES